MTPVQVKYWLGESLSRHFLESDNVFSQYGPQGALDGWLHTMASHVTRFSFLREAPKNL